MMVKDKDDIKEEALNLNRLECKAAFMSINVPEPRGPILIFGEQFMKKFYTVFDRDEKVLGFSIANQNNLNSEKTQSDLIKNINIKTPYDDNGDIISNDPNNNINKTFPTQNLKSVNRNNNSSDFVNGKVNNFRFDNFLEEKILDKTRNYSTSKIRFRERYAYRNLSNNGNKNLSMQKSNLGKDDVLFIHP